MLVPSCARHPSDLRYDTPPPGIDRRELQLHAIADQQTDEIPVHPSRSVRHDVPASIESHPIKTTRQLLGHDAGDGAPGAHDCLAAGTLTRCELDVAPGSSSRSAGVGAGSVRTHGRPAITATVCSKWADRLPSRVTAVQPSLRTFTAGLPAFTIGSMASTMPSLSRGPRPGSP